MAARINPAVELESGIDNLRAVLASASVREVVRGLEWYRNYRGQCVEALGLPASPACGIAAAFSINRAPGLALIQASAYINEGKRQHFSKQIDKAELIWNGVDPLDALQGEKERSFYRSLIDPDHPTNVCIDTHAWCAYFGQRQASGKANVPRGRRLEACKDAYRLLAREQGCSPAQLQAIVWTVYRRLHPLDGPHRLSWIPEIDD